MSKIFTITEGLENMGALRTGGQGSVYKGRRMGPIMSAVKVLPTPIAEENTTDANYRNFINEVEKLKKVNEIPNPNVVKILNSGITESGSLPFIEMEFIEGPDLGELLKPPHDPIFVIKEVIKLADQLACALSHCHKVGVKHGDVKSNNVKYNIHSGNYVLLDFGLSVMSDEQRRSSIRHAGAIEFMAPEQNEGQMLFQTDIYSFGVILYELLAGRVPFLLQDNGETDRNNVMIAHMESPVPDLMDFRRNNLPKSWSTEQQEREMQVPGWLLQLVSKCLEKKPEDRYADGAALHEAINNNIIAESQDSARVAIAALEAENEKLLHQLTLYRQGQAAEASVVKIPRRLLAGIVILLLGVSAYAIFRPSAVKKSVDVTPRDTSSVKFKKPVTTSDTAAVKDKLPPYIAPQKVDTAKPVHKKPVHKKKLPPKKKKKKFLGIFPIN
ncbi:MAG TPA: serine/threonine-protein kinase [Mucilaginibacter sp.]